MIERPYIKDGEDNGYLITTEAAVHVQTPSGSKQCAAGTMFHVLKGMHKMPAGTKMDGFVATAETGFYNVSIFWAIADEAHTVENEASLRRKIIRAENRRWLWRSIMIGASGGIAIELFRLILPWVQSLLSQ